ncbi:MAG: hypothetical protein HY541_06455 [Deltaproteobacteria bacterium]|nr:hypothetical protein [Deltaproteobacteria bacterium]
MKTGTRHVGFVLSVMAVMLLGVAPGLRADEGEQKEKPFKLSYKFGRGLTFESASGDYSLTLSAHLQGRFTYNALESAADSDTFAIQRGKIRLEGNVFDKTVKYGFQMDLSTRTGGTATLDDYYIDWVPNSYFGLKFGQYKVPFLVQELVADSKLQFVDRALSTGFFDLRRDIGVTFHGDIVKDKVNYAVFAINGDGANTFNTNQGIMGGARLEYAIVGAYDRTEPDADNSEMPNVGVGAAYVFHDSLNSTSAMSQSATIPVGTKSSLATVDVGLKYRGFSFRGAGMLTRDHEGLGVTNIGYNAQFGYFVVPKKFEIAVGQGAVFFDDATPNQYEYVGGLDYFIKGYPLRVHADYGLIMNNRGLNLNDQRVRAQVQLML